MDINTKYTDCFIIIYDHYIYQYISIKNKYVQVPTQQRGLLISYQNKQMNKS